MFGYKNKKVKRREDENWEELWDVKNHHLLLEL
jgi:hypothetical protein